MSLDGPVLVFAVIGLLGVVMLMAQMGGHGAEATRKILVVIGGFILLALIFGLVLVRTNA